MTAHDESTDWEPSEEGEPSDDDPAVDRRRPTASERSLAEYVQWGLLAILLLLTVIATLRFYFAASTAVDRFVTRQYRPLFQAAFNLVVLLAAGVGLSVLVRRLS